MNFLGTSILVLSVSALIYMILRRAYNVAALTLNWSTGYRLKHYWHRNFLKKELQPEYKKILTDYFDYYVRLNSENKLLFERRLQYFIDTKKFISRAKSLPLTDEMIVLISACAIQLTFGFPGIYFTHCYRILIYPTG